MFASQKHKIKLFIKSCRHGDLDAVYGLKNSGSDSQWQMMLEHEDYRGFREACERGHLDIVNYLHNNSTPEQWHAILAAHGYQGFIDACRNSHADVVAFLHKYATSEQWQNMLKANEYQGFRAQCYNGQIGILNYLHEHSTPEQWQKMLDAEAVGKTGIVEACERGNTETLEYLYTHCSPAQWQKMIDSRGAQGFMKAGDAGRVNVLDFLHKHTTPKQWHDVLDTSINSIFHPISDIRSISFLLAIGTKVESYFGSDCDLPNAIRVSVEPSLKKLGAENADDANIATRHFIFSSAYLAFELGLDPKAFVERQLALLEKQYHSDSATKRRLIHRPDFKTFLNDYGNSLGLRVYQEANDICDMVNECNEASILPQIHHALKLDSEEDIEDSISYEFVSQPIAAGCLLGRLDLRQILNMSDNWHITGNAISSELRPLKTGEWYKLLEKTTVPNIEYHGHAIYIESLCNSEQLKDEGSKERLAHCVAGYDEKCVRGERHILSVRYMDSEGKSHSLATIETDTELNEYQFRGKKNSPPGMEAKKAWNWLQNAVKNRQVKLNTMPKQGWGETAESQEIKHAAGISDLEGTIGYKLDANDTQQRIKACANHYVTKLTQMSETRAESRRETLGTQTENVLKRRAVGFDIVDFSPKNFNHAMAEIKSLQEDNIQHFLTENFPETNDLKFTNLQQSPTTSASHK